MSSVVPDGWEAKELGDIATFSGGSAFKEMYQGENSGKHPFIKVSDMNLPENNRYIVQANNWVSEEIRQQAKIKLFPSDSVVFAKVGAALLLNRRRQLVRETAIDNNMMAAIPNTCDHNFLYYLMQRIDLANIVQSGAVPSVNQSQMESIPTITPPLPEQKEIASILTSVDEVIENTQKQIDKLQDLKKATMNELLSKGIGHTEFKDSELGRIPKNWEVLTFSESDIKVLDGDRGNEYPKEADFKSSGFCLFLSAKNVTKNGFCFDTNAFITKDKDERLRKGRLNPQDIVITTRGTVGNIAFYDDSVNFNTIRINSGMSIVRNNNAHIECAFIYKLLSSGVITTQLKNLTFGSAQPQLTIGTLNELRLPIPPLAEQSQIVSAITSIQIALDKMENKLSQSKSLKKSLMQDLLTGKVRVTVN